MRKTYREQENFSIDLAPLIDIVFLLVIFLVITATFTKTSQLKIDLPTASSEEVTVKDSLEITISKDGIIGINNSILSSNDINEVAKQLQQYPTSSVVSISADKTTNYQEIISILDALGQLGFEKIKLKTIGAK